MVELFIAVRHILERKFQSIFSVLGVAIAVTVFVVSLTVSNGLNKNMVNSLLTLSPHILIKNAKDSYFESYQDILEKTKGMKDVKAVIPEIRSQSIIKYNELAKGVLRALMEMGYKVGGFDAYLDSSIIKSAGVSSSAAFENILCQIVSTLFNQGSIEPRTYAYAGQFAENIYWKKASGLLDQLTCGIGGILAINFVNPEDPLIRKIDFSFEACGYNIILVQTGNEHEDFKEEYSAIPHDMKKIAQLIWLTVFDFENSADHIRNEVVKICDAHPIYK